MKLTARLSGDEETYNDAHKVYDWCVERGYQIRYNEERTGEVLRENAAFERTSVWDEDGNFSYWTVTIEFWWLTDEQESLFRLRWGA